eukprot:CAMPEP_0113607858 /NCGR_PEP_ID=MMETSP0017_2-20120614/3611_1 /TAXON_ID=2856 /ORGANISM="Cylindrotheca closterium" /LENGTH=66 /DNA_ID=CAMNT_0000516495 /DNA_START=205 /DNA_END=405 /DNA_ORIENTATION=+ /assembly_acc=CAM_ASM_000147
MADATADGADDEGDATDPKAKDQDQKKVKMTMGGKKGTLTMGNVSGLKRAGMSRSNPRRAQAAADG